jgi:hypothetical protein
MAAPILELEGTWEEVRAHDAELAGTRVVLRVLEERTGNGGASHRNEGLLAALKRTEKVQQGMQPSSGCDTVLIIREGRSGAMYGQNSSD